MHVFLCLDRTRNINKEAGFQHQQHHHTHQIILRDISAGLAGETHKQVCVSNKDHVTNVKGRRKGQKHKT